MKAIVFGGSGFLGSHVADALSGQGFDVTVYDIKKSPYLNKNQKMIVGDILDLKKVMTAVKGNDCVYNFAGISDIDEAAKNPLKTAEVNILGNTHLLEACRANKVKRFIFASTLYVYSNSGSFYRLSKQSCELMIEAYAQAYGLDYTVLRYGSLYGPRSGAKNWIYRVLHQAVREKKITRHGDGKEIREYIHVLDAARLSVKILSKEFKNEYVIIAGQQSIQVENLMVMIKEMLNNKIKLEFVKKLEPTHYEVTPYNFTPKLAKRILNSTYVDLGQGILEMLKTIHEAEHGYHPKVLRKSK